MRQQIAESDERINNGSGWEAANRKAVLGIGNILYSDRVGMVLISILYCSIMIDA